MPVIVTTLFLTLGGLFSLFAQKALDDFRGHKSYNYQMVKQAKTPVTVAPTYVQARVTASVVPASIPTAVPNPTSTPVSVYIPTLTSVPAQAPVPSGNSVTDFIMNAINDYRRSKGLSAVSADGNTCSFASTRAQEIAANFNHDGFTNRLNSETLPYPSYSMVIENIAMTSNYQDVVNIWINSPSHAAKMEKDIPYVCVQNSGNNYVYEGWKP